MSTDYIAAAETPDYTAWAGNGEQARRIYDSGDCGAMANFQEAVNAAIGASVAAGMPIEAALAHYNPEVIAAGIPSED